jgi:hypothetical protein
MNNIPVMMHNFLLPHAGMTSMGKPRDEKGKPHRDKEMDSQKRE